MTRTATMLVRVTLLALTVTAAKCQLPWKRKAAAKPATVQGVDTLPTGADQRINGMRVVLTNQGVAKGVLMSDVAYTYDDNTRLELERVNVTFFDSTGAVDGVMTSRAGTYNQNQARLDARGDVIVTRSDGRRLTSPQLVWDRARNNIFSDSTFMLTEPTRQLSGMGFESDPKLTTFRCHRACKGVTPIMIPGR